MVALGDGCLFVFSRIESIAVTVNLQIIWLRVVDVAECRRSFFSRRRGLDL